MLPADLESFLRLSDVGIRDVRHMRGLGEGATIDDVREDAATFLVRRMRRPKVVDVTVPAHISDSRWCADCPVCGSGIAVCPEWVEGTCLECGGVVKVKFPSKREMQTALPVLLVREEKNRNWHPHKGEKAKDLKVENITRGLPLK